MFLRHFADNGVGVPYGIALGLGGLIAYPSSPLMVWALERLAST
jgi:prepilin peptidase CpaA